MKKLLAALLGWMSLCIACSSMVAAEGSRAAEWKAVQDAVEKGLPKTAITNLDAIASAALKEKAYPEAVKAIAQKIALEGTIQGNKPEEKITRLQTAMESMPKQAQPLMQALLADWYWDYFQRNRWRFMQRTATSAPAGNDFTTWDLPRLFAEIDRHFQASLANPETKKIPVSEWKGLLVQGTMPDFYRPTLFDFLAHEALAFYTSGEQAAARPQDAFEVSADSPALGTVEEFLAWRPWEKTQDTNSMVLRAIGLYQELLRFHQKDTAPAPAFADADLERLSWAWNVAFGEDKNARYKKALEAFEQREADQEISAMAMERHARVLLQENEPAAARKLALKGSKLFPESPGGKLCFNLACQIEAKWLNIATERVWNQPLPKITIRYKNVRKVYFRAVRYDWARWLEGRYRNPGNLERKELDRLIETKPDLEWTEALPLKSDYQEHTVSVAAPATLAKGYYFILASAGREFKSKDNWISFCDVWVSDLALVVRTRDSNIEGFVLDAQSGEPVAGAQVERWGLTQEGKRERGSDLTTDTNGFFSVSSSPRRQGWLLRARHGQSEIASQGDTYVYGDPSHGFVGPRTLFFTDRALYRPGQIIQYKGLSIAIDQEKDNYAVAAGREVTVIFVDTNGKEIARQKHRANDFGSFSGSFTAPADRLNGQMVIHTEEQDGMTSVRVEEYKRPKFQVTLDKPAEGVRLNEKVLMKGSAMGYTGAAVDQAQVKYRVVRQVQMPWWWGWWHGGGYTGQDQEIAHGTAATKTDGSFEVSFEAKADPKVAPKNEPTFVFNVTADVTDASGETRSASQSMRVGYTALEARMDADGWQTADKPVEIRVHATTLDGQPQVAEGSIKIHALVQPPTVRRAPMGGEVESPDGQGGSSMDTWPLGPVVSEQGFTTDTNGVAAAKANLKVGAYRAVLETHDRFGKLVTGLLPIQVVDPDANKLEIKVPALFTAPRWDAQPGDQFLALWGTGYEKGRAFIEIEWRHQLVQRFWTKPGQTQQKIQVPVTEAFRGGFTVHVTQVRENRSYQRSQAVAVPWENKKLNLSWEHFVSKLQPGQPETWTLVIKGPSGMAKDAPAEKAAAEMVATLYDESLDAFASLNWMTDFGVFAQNYSDLSASFANVEKGFSTWISDWRIPNKTVDIRYWAFPPELTQRYWGWGRYSLGFGIGGGGGMAGVPRRAFEGRLESVESQKMADRTLNAPAAAMPASAAEMPVETKGAAHSLLEFVPLKTEPSAGPGVNLDSVTARKNLNETAFFFPHLTTDSNGVVRMTFTMPEALTKWRFLGLAHDRAVRHGALEAHVTTSKDLMVQPNPPRFLREGDEIEFTVKVSNQSDVEQSGKVRLTFTDAVTEQAADKLLGNAHPEQTLRIASRESRSFAWRIHVPDGCGFLKYKAVAATPSVSDGEEGAIPVLSRRVFVTESLPLPIRGPATNQFEFKKLLESGKSKTLRSENLTVQMVSNPAWYAVLALPYLMEFPHGCAEQVFNRLYANCLARDIANRDPKIRRIFDLWKNTPALDSPLEKNQDLKSVMLEETPWLRQALAESSARKNIGVLFDSNRLDSETDRTLKKLMEMQIGNGQWPWFPGGPGDDYITLYITTGFGRMRHLGVDVNIQPALRSLARLDEWMLEQYQRIQEYEHPEDYVPSPTIALYLYGRSFFLQDRPIQAPHRKALDFFLARAREHWLKTASRQTQGHLALALQRFAKFDKKPDQTPVDIMASLTQRSVSSEEMGMFWRDTEYSWSWIHAPIETQALMIEAFDEITNDAKAVEECKVWLLKQKQTQDWKTTKATADAVYALLLKGRDLLASDALVRMKLDGIEIKPRQAGAAPEGKIGEDRFSPVVEPGTGFYEVRFNRAEITPSLGKITVEKSDKGVAWGGMHWLYFEDISKVTPHEGTPLKLSKALFIKKNTRTGPVLEPVRGPVAVGDELVVRIELRTDRDVEYVHMKDQRGSGTEPVNVLSRYKYQDGLGYYESTRDTASHFFISYLPKGVYVFEYSTRVQLRGAYETGMAEIQCMYAPEFNSHSQSIRLTVN